jgi:phage gp29-like protein
MKLWDEFKAAIGRPRAIEGEQMVVSDGLMASMVRPGSGGVYFMPVDEIIRSQGWKTYNDMLNDDQIKACLSFKKILVTGRDYVLAASDESNPKAVEAAKLVQWCLDRMDFTGSMYEACTAFEYGYSLGELVWTRDMFPVTGQQVVCLDKLPHRDPRELYLQMDEHGNYTGVKQVSMGQEIVLDPTKTWLYTYNKRFGNIYGNSDLRAAYRSWWAKKFVINFWNVFLERMGSPMMVMKYPQGASEALKATLKRILKSLASNTEVLVPTGVEIDLVEATRSGNASYQAALDWHNDAMARSFLLSGLFGVGGSGENTSRGAPSQSQIQTHLVFKMADKLSKELSATFMKQVVRQIIALNYGEDLVDTLMPQFVWQDYSEYAAQLIADEIRQLFVAGILDMDQIDINYVRSLLGLKQREEKDKPDQVVRPAPLPPAGGSTVPPPADQGNSRADKGGSAKTGDSTVDK